MENKPTGPKTFSQELQRLPIDYQRRIKWTLRIGAAWLSLVLGGAALFYLSKPYMDKQREEKIKSGKFFQEIQELEEKYGLYGRSYGRNNIYRHYESKDLHPPSHLSDIIEKVATEEKSKNELSAKH